jgi:hypothetical protein
VMGVGVGKVGGTLNTPDGIKAADHMAAIEHGGDIEFRTSTCAVFGVRGPSSTPDA